MFSEVSMFEMPSTSRLTGRGPFSAVVLDRMSAVLDRSPEYPGSPRVDCLKDRTPALHGKNRKAFSTRKGRGRRIEHG